MSLAQLLFNESQSRVVIPSVPDHADRVFQMLKERGVTANRLGAGGGDELTSAAAGETLRWSLGEIHDDWFNAIGLIVRET